MIAGLVLAASVFLPSLGAYNGGVGSDNLDYDCGMDSCHDEESTSTITMSASNTTPAPSGGLSVWVNISGGEAIGGTVGVMIVSATTTSGSLPSDAGWTIVSDPSGSTTYNYYEFDSYTGSASLEWTLTAPSALGVHMLFAREMHGGDGIYSNDYSEGLVFTVTDYSGDGGVVPVGGIPTLVITSPSNSATVSGNMTINANVIASGDDPVVSAALKIDGELVSELTAAPFTWVVDTTNMSEGGHIILVTVEDSTGDVVSKEVAVFVDNESEMISMLEWMVTMGAGAVIIICISGVMVVVALAIRKHVVERRSK